CASTSSAWGASCGPRTASARSSTSWSPPARARPSPASADGSTVLTADLIDARRRGDELHLIAFEGDRRALAERLSAQLWAAMQDGVGQSREEVEATLAAVDAPARARKLVLALRKLLDDHATWEGPSTRDPIATRRAVFERAAAVRRGLADD